eukprot:m.356824 g.356824  ORF g.356824 m.356824 type:complete len:266 (+) comp17635_c0_seq1:180-977(+)
MAQRGALSTRWMAAYVLLALFATVLADDMDIVIKSSNEPCMCLTFGSLTITPIGVTNASYTFTAQSSTWSSPDLQECFTTDNPKDPQFLFGAFTFTLTDKADANLTATISLTFNGTLSEEGDITDQAVSSWYLKSLDGSVSTASDTKTFKSNLFNETSSPYSSVTGYAVRCTADAAFPNVTTQIHGGFVNMTLQPFNVEANQTVPAIKQGTRWEYCAFEQHDLNHTLAIAVAGVILALMLGSLVLYLVRDRRKSGYTELPPGASH